MLKDSEIIQLQESKEYQDLIQDGLKTIVSDLKKIGIGKFKPEVSVITKIISIFIRERIIRQELCSCSKEFLEIMLNLEIKEPETPELVRLICEPESKRYVWMRYDVQRVKALFGRCINLMLLAKFRNLIKTYSTISEDKNKRIEDIKKEMQSLQIRTIRSIKTRGIFDIYVELTAEEFYRNNHEKIERRIEDSSKGGALGFLPEKLENNNDT